MFNLFHRRGQNIGWQELHVLATESLTPRPVCFSAVLGILRMKIDKIAKYSDHELEGL